MGRVVWMSNTISLVMEKAFRKVLPIPKKPRAYKPPPPPARPLTWLPHGRITNEAYVDRLRQFAAEILAIDRMRTHPVKYSSRGWGYLLEGLGKIEKDDLDSAQTAINDCRKLGLLPIDFVAEDQDETRRFQGILTYTSPSESLRRICTEVREMLDDVAFSGTDFWKGEKYYLTMCVEKGDLLNLFKPICSEYHIPIVSSKGWPPFLLRYHVATLSKRAEANGLTPVLLLFYDHDPAGLKISDTFRKNLDDIRAGVDWNTSRIIIERFGLNAEDIERYNLTWIPNLTTGSGRQSRDWGYINKFGQRKCEANALFKNDETLKAAEQICRKAVEKYYGNDALKRFREKEKATREGLKEVYDDPVWLSFFTKIEELANKLDRYGEEEGLENTLEATQEVSVELDSKYYGRCPTCGMSFNYDEKTDYGKSMRCRHCGLPMKLKKKEQGSG